MALALRLASDDCLHIASFSPTIRAVQVHPPWRLRTIRFFSSRPFWTMSRQRSKSLAGLAQGSAVPWRVA